MQFVPSMEKTCEIISRLQAPSQYKNVKLVIVAYFAKFKDQEKIMQKKCVIRCKIASPEGKSLLEKIGLLAYQDRIPDVCEVAWPFCSVPGTIHIGYPRNLMSQILVREMLHQVMQ